MRATTAFCRTTPPDILTFWCPCLPILEILENYNKKWACPPPPAVPTRNTLKVTGFHSSGRPLWSWLSLCLLALFPSTYFSGGFICCGPFGLLQHLLYRGFYDFCWLFSSSLLHTTFKVSVKHPGMHFTLSSYVYFIPKLNVFDYSTIFYELGRTYFYRGDFSRPVSTSIPR